MIQFPNKFFWGAATSAYQVEGGNNNCDWSSWERQTGKEPCGAACRQYELYGPDFDLARLLNHNAHRLSIEWSRIEPEEGRFSQEEIDHYGQVLLSLRERGLEPIVTLHHFTNPLWFAKAGGWGNNKASDYFLRYAEKIIEAFCDIVHYWVTINEPMVYTYHSFIIGIWPPQEKSFLKAKSVINNLTAAHLKAYRLTHAIYQKKKLASPFVSISQHMQAFVPCSPNFRNKFAAYLKSKFFNFVFIEKLVQNKALDFIGMNYYSRSLVDVEGWGLRNLAMDVCRKNHHPLKKNSLGWDIYPQGLYDAILSLKKYKLPVFILENGICTQDDNERWDFIREHLRCVHASMQQGGPKVLGYIYWSLIDNFEWDKGFRPRFGLIEVDYRNYQRRIRESAKKFSLVCKTGIIE
jgi:beta-glucosidase